MKNIVIVTDRIASLLSQTLKAVLNLLPNVTTSSCFLAELFSIKKADFILIIEEHVSEERLLTWKEWQREIPQAQLIWILTAKPDVYDIRRLIKTNPAGILDIHAGLHELESIIQGTEISGTFLSSSVQQDILEGALKDINAVKAIPFFNKLELQILECAINGQNIQSTAHLLKRSTNTIAAYRSKMLRKAQVKSILELVAKYGRK